MKIPLSNTFICFIVTGLLFGCSTSYVKVDETHTYQESQNLTFKRLLVIGVTSPKNLRHSFENIFADSLQRHGVAAVASYKHLENLKDTGQRQVRELAVREGADAVVISRVISKSEHTGYSLATGHAEYRVVSETTTTENSSTTVAMAGAGYVPGEIDQAGAFLLTNVFDAENGQLVWSAKSHAAGVSDDKMDVCWKLSFALTEALGRDNLIKITVENPKIPSL